MSYPTETLVAFVFRDTKQWLIQKAGKSPEEADVMVSVLSELGEGVLQKSWMQIRRYVARGDKEVESCLDSEIANTPPRTSPDKSFKAGLVDAPTGFNGSSENWLETLKGLIRASHI